MNTLSLQINFSQLVDEIKCKTLRDEFESLISYCKLLNIKTAFNSNESENVKKYFFEINTNNRNYQFEVVFDQINCLIRLSLYLDRFNSSLDKLMLSSRQVIKFGPKNYEARKQEDAVKMLQNLKCEL